MKYLKQLMIILIAYFVGMLMQWAFNLPIPGTVIGLILLFLALYFGIVKTEMIEDICEVLISHMPFLFIPAGVGLIKSFEMLQGKIFIIFHYNDCFYFGCLDCNCLCCQIFKKGVVKMNDIISSPVFGVLISIIAYEIGALIKQKLKLSIFNPLLIAIIILIVSLSKFNIEYNDYNNGGQIISFLLSACNCSLSITFI